MSEQFVINKGIASVKVEVFDAAPNIDTNPVRSNFDVSAEMFPILQNSPYFAPLLTEYCKEWDLGTFSALYPSKRKYYVNNFFNQGDEEGVKLKEWKEKNPKTEYITWKNVSYKANSQSSGDKQQASFLVEYLKDFNQVEYNPELIGKEEYKGPVFEEKTTHMEAPPNDRLAIKNFFEIIKGVAELDETPEETEKSKEPRTLNIVFQKRVLDGLWWGLESSNFITEDMPFWINIKRQDAPITTKEHPTSIIISLGLDNPEQRYDIKISMDQKPALYDYAITGEGMDYKVREWDIDFSRILSSDNNIEIGIMTAGARLIIHVNKVELIYTRTEAIEGGKIKLAKISPGSVRVFGTNIQAEVSACPMTFAPLGCFALPIPGINDLSTSENKLTWKGVLYTGEPGGSVAELPTPPSERQKLFGVDCKTFSGDGGECSPKGLGFHQKGVIKFRDSKKTTIADLSDTTFYIVSMQPVDGKMLSADGIEYTIPYSGCPYFFRIKGAATESKEVDSSGGTDISSYVISVSENSSAPDYFHVKKSATITVYNEGGALNSLLNTQKAVRISWGWNGSYEASSFTGVVTNVSLSETPGMETLTLQCEDYTYILKNSPILNSPFYDGMVAKYAILDLAKRGGCIRAQSNFSSEKDYFLPSGFAYTKPAVKFQSTQMIFECILSLAKRFEAYFYFDGEGRFILEKLPGGLFSQARTFEIEINQDPKQDAEDADTIILGEKNVTTDFNSTVNVISVVTLERDTRNIIYKTIDAQGTGLPNKLLFRKTYLQDQAAYGELAVATKYARELGKRMFKPILKTTFKTVGGTYIKPLGFVKVLGRPFRAMSIKRTFSAETNDFTQDVECEWLGG